MYFYLNKMCKYINMGRKNANKSFFHYCVETFDENNQFVDRKYYMTSKDVIENYKCSQKSFFNHLKEPNKKSKKLGKVKIYRILEPVHVLAPNPDLI